MAGWVRKWNVGQGSLLAKWGKAPVPDTPLAQEGEDKGVSATWGQGLEPWLSACR